MGTDVVGSSLPWIDAIAGSFAPYSFTQFHEEELARLVDRHGHLVNRDLQGVDPIAFRVDDGTTYTWRAARHGVEAVVGDAAAPTLMELSEATFSEYLHELLTASGAVRTGRASSHAAI